MLVTPVEKLGIEVEDSPFVAVELKTEGERQDRTLAFRLNTGEMVVAGPENPLRFEGGHPYLEVRAGLEASVVRPAYYELAEIALAEAGDPPGVWSRGAFFPIETAR